MGLLAANVAQLVPVGSVGPVVAELAGRAEATMSGWGSAEGRKASPLKLNDQAGTLLQARLAAAEQLPALGDQSVVAELGVKMPARSQKSWCRLARAAGLADVDATGLKGHRDRLLGTVVSHYVRGYCCVLGVQAALQHTAV